MASQATSQASWDFYKTGKPCTVSGNSGGCEAFFKITLTNCAVLANAVEAESVAVEKAEGGLTCNCSPLVSDCSPIQTVLDQIRQGNLTKKEKITISKVDNKKRLSNDVEWVSALNGIDIEGKCFKIALDYKFNGDKKEWNPKKYIETKDGFDLLDENGKTILSIQILGEVGQSKYFKQEILKKYLLLEEKKNIDSTKTKLKLVYVNSDDKEAVSHEIEELLLKILTQKSQ